MVGPDYTPPEFYGDKVIAQELKLQKKHQIPQNWYALFGDEQLNCLIEYGLKNNTDIDVAVARLKQARASLNISKAGFLPQVNVQGGYDYQKNSKNIGPTADVDYYMAGFDAVWEVDLWGKGRRQDEAASAQLKSEEYSLANVKSVVTAELALNYISLKLAVEKQKLAEQNARLQKNIYNMVKAKYESGLADDIAYNQAAYLLSSTEAQIPFYQGEIEQYKKNPSECDNQFLAKKWLEESLDYKSAVDKNGNENKEYFFQDMELDAFAYAYAVMLYKYGKIDYINAPQKYINSEFVSIVEEWIQVFKKENL